MDFDSPPDRLRKTSRFSALPETPPLSPTSASPYTTSFAGLHDINQDENEDASWNTRRRSTFATMLSINTAASNACTNTGLPFLSPAAPSAQPPDDKQYQSGQPKSLEGIAIRSFCLGLAHASCVLTMSYMLLFTSSPLWRIYFFGGALATFHFLEFWTTAKYNTSNVMISSFLLTENWPNYFIAHTSAFFECLLTNLIAPNRSWAPFYSGHLLLLLGLIMVVVGQTARSAAMIHAGRSFNHRVQTKKRQDHELVTTGIYSYIRHPSYFGFFYWAIGTQLVLGNPLCFIMFAGVLWYFFSTRVKHEETKLVEFFKDDYVNYRKRVGTAMPFVG